MKRRKKNTNSGTDRQTQGETEREEIVYSTFRLITKVFVETNAQPFWKQDTDFRFHFIKHLFWWYINLRIILISNIHIIFIRNFLGGIFIPKKWLCTVGHECLWDFLEHTISKNYKNNLNAFWWVRVKMSCFSIRKQIPLAIAMLNMAQTMTIIVFMSHITYTCITYKQHCGHKVIYLCTLSVILFTIECLKSATPEMARNLVWK